MTYFLLWQEKQKKERNATKSKEMNSEYLVTTEAWLK
jgi:hypothetical protein